MSTQLEIEKAALVRLGVVPPDQTPTSLQSQSAARSLSSWHERMIDEGRVNWELNNIPASLVSAVTSILAFEMRDDFSVPNSRYERIGIARAEAVRDISKYIEIPYSGGTEIQDH